MMLERETALEALNLSLERVADLGGQAVFVQGEAGIGKTTLINAFLDSLPDGPTRATALCDPLNTPRPLGPVRDLARALIPRREGSAQSADVFEDLVHHVQSAPGPFVLVIEDLHWADRRSLDWLTFVGRRMSQLPVLFIGSFRSDEVSPTDPLAVVLRSWPRSRRHDMELTPLSLHAVRQLAQGCPLSGAQVRQITGGNPFFVTELLNAGGDTRQLPNSVTDAVNSKLDLIGPEAQRFVELVSCCPALIHFETLRAMGLEDAARLCDEAIAARILIPDEGNFRFRHELVRRAAYARMLPAAKRQSHERFLSALLTASDSDEQLDLIVHHAQGAFRHDLVQSYGRKAAEAAARLGAHREAARYLAAVLDQLGEADPRTAAEIHERWAYEAGLALEIDTDVIAARERAVALWRSVGEAARVGDNLSWLSRLHWYRGEAELAQRYVHEAIDTLEGQGAGAAQAKAYGLRAQFHMLQDDMEAAVRWGQRAHDLAVAEGEHELIAHALNTIGSARMFRGDPGGEAQLRQSLAVSLDHRLHEQAARVYTNLSECLLEMRRFDEAETLLDEGIAFDTANDLDSWTYYLVGRKAQLSFELDRYDEALAIAQSVLARDGQTLLMQMPAMIIAARCKLRLGQADAPQALAAAQQAATQIKEPQYLVAVALARIEAAIVLGEDPAPVIAEITAGSADQLSPRKLGELLFWAKLAGQTVDWPASNALPPAFQAALSPDAPPSAEAFLADQSAYLAGWTLVMAGDPAAADALFERIGAQAARKALRARPGVRLPAQRRGPYRAARRHPHGLTRAEQTIVKLIAEGKSNATIAAELSRSPRTVENHVSSILSKLHCANRLEVVLRLQSESWILGPDAPAAT